MYRSNLISLTLTRLTMALLLATVVLLAAASASASKQALVKVTYKNQWLGGTTFTIHTGTGYATVNTTTTPTPSVMWPANIISSQYSLTYTGPYTIYADVRESYRLKAGTIQKSHAGAAPSGGSIVAPPTATTLCFASRPPYAQPGPPALPGSCFPRGGSGMRTPGAKSYGGTARLLRDRLIIGTSVNFSVGGVDIISAGRFFTSRLTGPDTLPVKYGIVGGGPYTATVLGTQRVNMVFETQAPLTTGVQTVMGGDFATQLTRTGSHNFNTTNLTGMISMVKPFLRNTYARNSAGDFTGQTVNAAAIRNVSFIFAGEIPEPGVTLLLGCGALGLAGLSAARRR